MRHFVSVNCLPRSLSPFSHGSGSRRCLNKQGLLQGAPICQFTSMPVHCALTAPGECFCRLQRDAAPGGCPYGPCLNPPLGGLIHTCTFNSKIVCTKCVCVCVYVSRWVTCTVRAFPVTSCLICVVDTCGVNEDEDMDLIDSQTHTAAAAAAAAAKAPTPPAPSSSSPSAAALSETRSPDP